LLESVPEELGKVIRFFSKRRASDKVEAATIAQEEARKASKAARKDARFIFLNQSRSTMVTTLHMKLGLTTKPRAPQETFSDALNGRCSWQNVDAKAIQSNIEDLLRQHQTYLRDIKGGAVPGVVEICQKWDAIKQKRTDDPHASLQEIIAFYSVHLDLGDQLEPEHAEMYDFFKSIE
jgi:hypothetical protein